MASERRRIPIADLLQDGVLAINDGYRAKNSELATHGLPFARAQNINGGFNFEGADCFPEADLSKVGNKISQPGDVVFTSKGTVGRFAFVREDTPRFVYAPQLCFWRALDPKRLNARWLFYWMQSREFYVQYKGVAAQTDMAEYVSLSDQRRMYITLPPIEEQRAIAAVLGVLDDRIELNRRMCRTLEGIARAIFQAWFVDFEPVRAKAAGAKSFRGMPQAVFDSLPTQFVDSPLGPIPKGWRVACAGDVAEVNAWTLGRSDDLDYIDYIEISEVMRGEVGQIVRHERGNEPSRAKRRLRHGDTVLSTVRPDREAYFLCLNPPETLIASTGFAVLSPRNGMWAFLYSAMTRPDVSDELGRLADGGAYPAVRPEVVAAREFVVPGNPAITRAFEAVAESLFEKAWHCRQQSRTLAGVRDALLPKLVSGELRLPAALRDRTAQAGIQDVERIIGRRA